MFQPERTSEKEDSVKQLFQAVKDEHLSSTKIVDKPSVKLAKAKKQKKKKKKGKAKGKGKKKGKKKKGKRKGKGKKKGKAKSKYSLLNKVNYNS